jgi:Uma2 family endonuclease
MNAPQFALNQPQPARFTVDEFIRLHETGVLDKYSKSELISGEIICMNSQWSPHARLKSELAFALAAKLGEIGSDLRPQIEVSVRLSDDSLPEPDITLTAYRGKGAVPVANVAMLIEVADTTLDNDLDRKSDLYAAAGVPEYWVIDLTENRALLHEHPSADGYLGQADVLLGEVLHSATILGLSVETGALMG